MKDTKIVILDGYTVNPGDLSWDALEKIGLVEVYERTSLNDEEEIITRIGNAEIVVTNKTPITRKVIDACQNIKLISVLATGYNVIDSEYAREKNILVANVPTYGTKIVAQFAIALLLEVCHHVGHHSQTVFGGRWETNDDWCYWDYPLIELSEKTVGIIGFGRIGQQTGAIAKAMGMNVLAYDANINDSGKEIGTYVELNQLLSEADVIMLHCPLTTETNGLINKNTINQMKDGVIIINNSRGALIVETDLAFALETGKVKAAGLDVVSIEPIQSDNPLLKAPNCLITPHISWAAIESRKRILESTAMNIKAYMDGGAINIVN